MINDIKQIKEEEKIDDLPHDRDEGMKIRDKSDESMKIRDKSDEIVNFDT